MITLLTGENSYEVEQALGQLVASYEGEAEKIDGADLEIRLLPDLFMNTGLFTEKKMIIIKGMSVNKSLWGVFPEWVERIDENIHVVLVEPSPDKRTKTYKLLQKYAEIREFKLWGEREVAVAERWTEQEAKRMGVALGKGAARLLVDRSFVTMEKGIFIDQWRLVSSLEKLAPLGSVGPDEVEKYIDQMPVESVFGLLETALRGDSARVKEMVETLHASEDPFRLFGLMSSQAFWLAALVTSNQPNQAVAKDFAAHPFILGKLSPHAKKLGLPGVRYVSSAFAEADTAMKTTAADPWLLIERALIKIAHMPGRKISAK